jgi:hypothetical protein
MEMNRESFGALLRYDGDASHFRGAVRKWVYFLVTVFVARYAWQVSRGGDGYKTGDWLINYQGGFVRRGLIGEVLFNISSLGPDLLWATFLVQSAIYFGLAWLILDLFFSRRRRVADLLLIFSPAFIFLFPFYSIAGGFRKEILAYLSFTVLVWGIRRGMALVPVLAVSFLCYGLALFSHEIAFFALPYFLYVFYTYLLRYGRLRNGHAWATVLLFALFACIGFGASVAYSGNSSTGDAILESLKGKGLDPAKVGGAIGWFDYTTADTIGSVVQCLRNDGYKGYLHSLFLSLVPVFYAGYHKRHSLLLPVSFLCMVPLFILGTDWGRWIAYWIFFVYLHLLAEEPDARSGDPLPLWMVLLYAMTWAIHHHGNGAIGLGIFEAFT